MDDNHGRATVSFGAIMLIRGGAFTVLDGIYAIATYGAALDQARVPDASARPAPRPSEARAAGPHFG
jgi:hypothetical protein